MNKRLATCITIILALSAVAVPIFISLYIANQESHDSESQLALTYARDILHRSEETAAQIEKALNTLSMSGETDPCSPIQQSHMHHYDLDSSYIQALGHITGTRIQCSSLGDVINGFDIGAPDTVQPTGTRLWYNIRFPFTPENTFIGVELQGYLAIIHKDLPLDVSMYTQDIALGVFSRTDGQMMSSRGEIHQEWVKQLKGLDTITFMDNGHLVAIVPSERYLLSAITSTPVERIAEQTRKAAMVLVPVGVVAGLILAWAVVYLARVQQSMPSLIKSALKRKEFFVVYQPVVDLKTGQWVGAEALIRWRRSDGVIVRPDLFIPVAEDTGLIREITAHVLELVEEDMMELFRRFPDFHVGINLSAADLDSYSTVELIKQLGQKCCSKKNFVVEITERGFSNPDTETRVLEQFRQAGVAVAMDDFGTGYSSLSHLQKIDLDILKIDKSFVDTIGVETAKSQVIWHIIEMAKSLNLQMIAEGIETEQQANFLREQGVQYGQGWLFAKPMIYSELLACLNFPSSPILAHS